MTILIVFVLSLLISLISKKVIEILADLKISWILAMVISFVSLGLLVFEVELGTSFIAFSLLFLYLLVTGWIDALTFDVYDIVNYVFIALGLLYNGFYGGGWMYGVIGFVSGLLSFGAIYLIALLLYKKEAFGLGDVWILGAIGAFLGWKGALLVGVASFYIAAIHLIFLVIKNGKLDRKQRISFGPYICISAWVYILYGNEMINIYFNLL